MGCLSRIEESRTRGGISSRHTGGGRWHHNAGSPWLGLWGHFRDGWDRNPSLQSQPRCGYLSRGVANRARTPGTRVRSRLAGVGATTARARLSSRTESSPRISSILPLADWDSLSATAGSPTARRRFSRVSTPCIFGAAFSHRWTCSTSTIRVTTWRAAPSSFPPSAFTWISKATAVRGQLLLILRGGGGCLRGSARATLRLAQQIHE